MTAAMGPCSGHAANPSGPPKPPILVRTGCVRGFEVRPASESVVAKRGSDASRCARPEASVVRPRMRTRIGACSMMTEPAICTGPRWLSIVGIGEDGVEGLSSVAAQLIRSAELVVGGARHLELASELIRGRRLAWPSPITYAFPDIERHRGPAVAILSTAHPSQFGVGH